MLKKMIFIFCLMTFCIPWAFAQEIPVKIAPEQVISTEHDEIEVGDTVSFEAVNDVYDNGKLYIKKHTSVIGVVAFLHNNGWANDKAEILFNKFYFKDSDNKKIEINYPLKIETSINASPSPVDVFKYYVLGTFRGSEIYIEPDTKVFNIFIER